MTIANTSPNILIEQLLLLKRATVSTGAIHEAQKLQLEMWPRMLTHVSKVLDVGINHDKKLVVFNCKKAKQKPTDKDIMLYQAILTWVRNILWDETNIVIKLDKKVAYDSRKP